LIIRVVLFDLDETLLNRTESLRAFLPGQYERFRGRLGKAEIGPWINRFLALDKGGTVHKSLVYARLLSTFDGDSSATDILLDDYRQNASIHAKAFDGMTDTLSKLRNEGLKLGIVTNGETSVQRRNIQALGLSDLVHLVLISEEEGVRKPDKAIFLRASHRLGVKPKDCLFVGDNPLLDILGAHEAGMYTAWFSFKQIWPRHLPPRPGASVTTLNAILPLAAGLAAGKKAYDGSDIIIHRG
jgi:putative hydrolase of the HAD superfamily